MGRQLDPGEAPPLGKRPWKDSLHGLTVREPWASAIKLADPRQLGDRAKMLENRTWPPWEKIVGKYIAIHAGQNQIDADDARNVWRQLYGNDADHESFREWGRVLLADAGKFLCVAKVAGFTRDRAVLPKRQHQWQIPGMFGWILDDVRALPRPIEHRGQQGLWVVPNEIERQIREQVSL